MDYMFQEVRALTRVELISDGLKITKLESTFEKYTNLLSFYMKGFDTSSVK